MSPTRNLSLRQFRSLCIIANGLPPCHDVHTGQEYVHRRQSLMTLVSAGLLEELPRGAGAESFRLTAAGREFYDGVASDLAALFRGEPSIAPAEARGGLRHQPPPHAELSKQTTSFQNWMEKVAHGHAWEVVRREFDSLLRAFKRGDSVPAARRDLARREATGVNG